LAPGEVGWPDRKLEVVGQVGRRLAIALAFLAVALEALGRLIERLAPLHQRRGGLRRIADLHRRLGLLVLPAAREGLDERDDREPPLGRTPLPTGPGGAPPPPRHPA